MSSEDNLNDTMPIEHNSESKENFHGTTTDDTAPTTERNETSGVIARAYQREMLEKSLQGNTIVVVSTLHTKSWSLFH